MSEQPADHRLYSIDALRGLVMVIMALDHVRDFFHSAAQQFQPDDLQHTTAAIFLTRWVTHICAPTFMFTAGMSAYFWQQRHGRTPTQLSRFLLIRGLWLVLLELTVLRAGFSLHFFSAPILLTVLWALGWSMVALAALSRIPLRALALLSVGAIALHNLADPIRGNWLWSVLHRPATFQVGGATVHVAYPLIPWIFVMAAGFCFGPVMQFEPAQRRKVLVALGSAASLAFIALRALNVYGNPRPWADSWLSFLNTTKYPPSLDYLLMTLGPALLLLAWFDSRPQPNRVLIVYGRAPLFYFLGHFCLVHLMSILFAIPRYGLVADPYLAHLPDYGFSLPVVYLIWILVVALMYPACRWYSGLRTAPLPGPQPSPAVAPA